MTDDLAAAAAKTFAEFQAAGGDATGIEAILDEVEAEKEWAVHLGGI
jgi:hypothetical protein